MRISLGGGSPRDPNSLASGVSTLPRLIATNTGNLASGNMRLTYFTPDVSFTATQLRTLTGSTAAGATPTLCKMALYSVDDDGDLTLLSATANDTTLFGSATSQWTRSLLSPVDLVAGQRYAFAWLVVSGATLPNIVASGTGNAAEWTTAPRLTGQVTGQTDVPASVAAGSVATVVQAHYGVALP